MHARAGLAREAAYFATAPFIGALAAVPLLGERLRGMDLVVGALMASGVVLLLRERHGHVHTHAALEHEHLHVHDAHHQHPHVSDLHHRHKH